MRVLIINDKFYINNALPEKLLAISNILEDYKIILIKKLKDQEDATTKLGLDPDVVWKSQSFLSSQSKFLGDILQCDVKFSQEQGGSISLFNIYLFCFIMLSDDLNSLDGIDIISKWILTINNFASVLRDSYLSDLNALITLTGSNKFLSIKQSNKLLQDMRTKLLNDKSYIDFVQFLQNHS